MQFKRLDREVRITEPYRRLSKGFARPETTVLMALNGTCWSEPRGSLYRMFRFQDMWFQTLVTMVAVLSDINIIAVASVLYSDGQAVRMFYASSYPALCITGLMMVVVLLTMMWWRRGIVSKMPRRPDTIGTVFSYLCASQMAKGFGGARLEDATGDKRDATVRSI